MRPHRVQQCMTLGILVSAATAALGQQQTYWNVATGNWSTAGNWTDGEPTTNHTAYVNNGGTVTVSQSGENCKQLRLGQDWDELGFAHMTGGDLDSQYDFLAYYSRGDGPSECTFTQEGGSHTVLYAFEMCVMSLSRATYNLSGGTLTSNNNTIIGRAGTATFNHTGGTHTVYDDSDDDFIIGCESGSSGLYFLSGTGSLVSTFEEYVGFYGDGYVRQFGAASSHEANVLTVGGRTDGSGVYELEAGTITMSNRLGVGGADGLFVQTGGTINNRLSGSLNVGTQGRYELHAGEIQLPATDVNGSDTSAPGKGVFLQTGGSHTVSSVLWVSSGTYEISGGEVDVADLLWIGWHSSNWRPGDFKVVGDDPAISCGTYLHDMYSNLYSIFDADGISTINVSGTATLDGDWYVEDPNGVAPNGRFEIIATGGGIVGSFDNVHLPGPDWSWGIDDGHTLFLLRPCTGDVDGDGDTDLSDLAALLASYNKCEGDPDYNPAADFDGSGCVDLSDLAFLLANYGCGT